MTEITRDVIDEGNEIKDGKWAEVLGFIFLILFVLALPFSFILEIVFFILVYSEHGKPFEQIAPFIFNPIVFMAVVLLATFTSFKFHTRNKYNKAAIVSRALIFLPFVYVVCLFIYSSIR